MNKFLKGICVFGVLYSLLTVVSSSIQLAQGWKTDSNVHILSRAVITFIPIFMYFVLRLNERLKPLAMTIRLGIHYVFCLGAAFFMVYLWSLAEELAPTAYRDIFWNFSIVYLVVAVIIITISFRNHRK